MSISRFFVILLAAVGIVVTAHAQKAPRIGYVYPAGGQQGQTFEVTLGGQFLGAVSGVHFTGSGIEAVVIGYERPLSGKETELLRDKLKQLEGQRKALREKESEPDSAKADQEIASIRERIAKFGNGPQFNVAIAENVKLRITLALDATLGEQEIRLSTAGGLSNPLVFCIGQLPEFSEPAARGSLKAEIDGKPRGRRNRGGAKSTTVEDDKPSVPLPAVYNGQVLPGEADRIRFAARRGQRVLFSVSARKLIPYLPDAVPGWFQATLAIYDSKGRELAYVDDFGFNPDPALCYVIAEDGEYELEIRDAIYRGREDFVYRITAGELPFITSIFPLGGTMGGRGTVELRGWNLNTPTIPVDLRESKAGILPLVVSNGQIISNFVPFAVDSLPEALEREPNNSTSTAQAVALPLIIDGRIDRPEDADIFRVEGKGGSEIVAEIRARRLNSPLDSQLRLTNAAGQQIAFNDDSEDKGAGLTTHHADSRLVAKFPNDGTYFIHVGDVQHNGGPEFAYRLRVSEPEPDFELRVVPSSISGRGGSSVPITVYALRKDGFTGEIAVALIGASAGMKLNGGIVPDGKDQAKLTLALPDPQDVPVTLQIEGRACIAGREIVHPAVPADDMQQAFAYHHLVAAKALKVAVAGQLAAKGKVSFVSATPIKITAGGSARVQIAAEIGDKAREVQFAISDSDSGFSIKSVTVTPGGADIEISSDASKISAGEKANLTLHAFAVRTGTNGRQRRIPLGALPSVPIEVIPDPNVAGTSPAEPAPATP